LVRPPPGPGSSRRRSLGLLGRLCLRPVWKPCCTLTPGPSRPDSDPGPSASRAAAAYCLPAGRSPGPWLGHQLPAPQGPFRLNSCGGARGRGGAAAPPLARGRLSRLGPGPVKGRTRILSRGLSPTAEPAPRFGPGRVAGVTVTRDPWQHPRVGHAVDGPPRRAGPLTPCHVGCRLARPPTRPWPWRCRGLGRPSALGPDRPEASGAPRLGS
jgi:hypothetical protein